MQDQGGALSVTGEGWRTLLDIWLVVSTIMLAGAVSYGYGADFTLRVTGQGIPLLTAAVAFLGVRQSLRQKQVADDRSHWWDQTKWAFDVVLDQRSETDDLLMALDTLLEQMTVNEVDGADLRRVVAMATKARRRLRALGVEPRNQYDEQQKGRDQRGQTRIHRS